MCLAASMAEKYSSSHSEEAERFARWGLGRGVDITNSSPWLDKTSFQVRNVNPKELIETDHGGLLNAFSEEVRSKTSLNNEIKSGIKAPNTPFTVRMDAEYARSALSNKYVVGTKIKKRTIAFRVDFVDVPQSRVKNVEEAREEIIAASALSDTEPISLPIPSPSITDESEEMCCLQVGRPTQASPSSSFLLGEIAREGSTTSMHQIGRVTSQLSSAMEVVHFDDEGVFEERLCKWLKNCLQHHGYTMRPEEHLRDSVHTKCSERDNDFLTHLERHLDHFVETFGITHYVNSIELGAMCYNEVSGKDFVQHAGLVSKSAVDTALYGGVEASTSFKIAKSTSKESTHRKIIGKMDQEEVTEEAVIGCQFTPISSLIKMPFLKHALRESTAKYTKAKSRIKGEEIVYI